MPAGGRFPRQIRPHSPPRRDHRPHMWTPAHASKAAPPNGLPAWLSAKRTAALDRPRDRYPGQRIFVVRREDYVYLVPFPPSPVSLRGAEADVEDEQTVFLKTLIPSRKATRQYLGEESDDHED